MLPPNLSKGDRIDLRDFAAFSLLAGGDTDDDAAESAVGDLTCGSLLTLDDLEPDEEPEESTELCTKSRKGKKSEQKKVRELKSARDVQTENTQLHDARGTSAEHSCVSLVKITKGS
jgi:hypothetical protein